MAYAPGPAANQPLTHLQQEVLASNIGSAELLARLLTQHVPLPDDFPDVMGQLAERYGYRERELLACLSSWGVPLHRPFGNSTHDIRIVLGWSDSTVSPLAIHRIIALHDACGGAQAGVVADSHERHSPAGKVSYYFAGLCVFVGSRTAERLVCYFVRHGGAASYLIALHYCAGVAGHVGYCEYLALWKFRWWAALQQYGIPMGQPSLL